jgi:hypothetical protein
MRMQGVLVVAVCLVLGATVAADPIPYSFNAAIYAGGTITFSGWTTVRGGPILAGGDVTHGTIAGLDFESLYSAGGYKSSGFDECSGPLYVNGTVDGIGGPGSQLGPITSTGGSVLLHDGSQTVNGDVTAAANVDMPFSISTIKGSVRAGGNVSLQGDVDGGVTYGGSLTMGTFATVSGPVVKGGPVSPAPYVLPGLPQGRLLSSSGPDVTLGWFESRTLLPGNYGTLKYDSANTVTLTAGSYVFADIISTFSLNKLAFDTSGGPIDIFIAKPQFTFDLMVMLNGKSLSTTTPDADWRKVFLEVPGDLTLADGFCGTIFAPNGNVQVDTFSDVNGQIIAGGNVTLAGADVIATPEPCMLFFVLGGAMVMLKRRARTA